MHKSSLGMKKMDLDPDNGDRVSKDSEKERIFPHTLNCMPLGVTATSDLALGINIEAKGMRKHFSAYKTL